MDGMADGWMDGWMPSVSPEIIYRHVPAGTTNKFPIFNFNGSLDTYANVRGHTNITKKNFPLFSRFAFFFFLSSLVSGGEFNRISPFRGRRILRYSTMR